MIEHIYHQHYFLKKKKSICRHYRKKSDSYLSEINTQVVPATLLVLYKGSRYSVPQKYIGQKVRLIPQSNKLYIYFNTELIVCHI